MEIDSNPPEGAIPVIEEPEGSRALDLVFILDCTGSMGSYIAVSIHNFNSIGPTLVPLNAY